MKDNILVKEMRLFNKKLPSLLRKHRNKFVLIKNDEIEIFANEKKAIQVGTRKYALTGSFLVKKITRKQEIIPMPPALRLGLLRART